MLPGATVLDLLLHNSDLVMLLRLPLGQEAPVTTPDGVTSVFFHPSAGCRSVQSAWTVMRSWMIR